MASATEISRLDYIEKEKLEKLLSLVDLDSDVLSILINEPEDGQTLVYEATSGKWKNKAVSGGGDSIVVTVDPLTDELSMTFLEIGNAIFVENKMVSIFYNGAMYYYQHGLGEGEDPEDTSLVFASILSAVDYNDNETVELETLIVNANGFENKAIELYPQGSGGLG